MCKSVNLPGVFRGDKPGTIKEITMATAPLRAGGTESMDSVGAEVLLSKCEGKAAMPGD